jgi:hypothetical protein
VGRVGTAGLPAVDAFAADCSGVEQGSQRTPLDLGVRTPLIDLFQSGDVPRDVRLLAARGQVASGPTEQLALLAISCADHDIDIAIAARETLAALPSGAVARYLAGPDVPDGLRSWCLLHAVGEVEPSGDGDPGSGDVHHGLAPCADDDPEVVEEKLQLSSLPVPARIKLAMLGSREQRAILVRDPNRVVSSAVLSSPKLTDTEVETFARMGNVSVDVLRIVGSNRSWLRNYGVVSALVRNPRTPPAISLGLVPRLQERDVKALAVDRNVPEALRIASRKVLQVQHSRRS